MPWVARTRRPRRVYKLVMEMLLNIGDNLGHVPHGVVSEQSVARSSFDDCLIMPRADGGFDVCAKQRNDAILIPSGHATGCLTPLTVRRTRLTGRYAFLHHQMIAAEEATADGTPAPASYGRFATTCRALEFERNDEHFVGRIVATALANRGVLLRSDELVSERPRLVLEQEVLVNVVGVRAS